MSNGIYFRVQLDAAKIMRILGLEEQGRVQKFIDSEVLRLCNQYVPRKNGILIKSGTTNTKIGSGEVKWSTPYARRWYYTPANFTGAPVRGNYWGQRAMQEGGAQSICAGVKKLVRR